MAHLNLHLTSTSSTLPAAAQEREQKTLRLTVPSWHGGTLPLYYFGSQLLTLLAPPTTGPTATVEVPPPAHPTRPLPKTNGVTALYENLSNLQKAAAVCEAHQPDNIVVLGGDCLAELAPFAYLAHRYRTTKFGILWLDAHPDIQDSQDWPNAHAYVLASLAGKGDREFTDFVKAPVPGSRIMVAGMHHPAPVEEAHIRDYGVRTCGPEDIVEKGSATVLDWIRSEGITHLAIHLDLDVLATKYFRMLYFCDPRASPGAYDGIPQGMLEFSHVAKLVQDVAAQTRVVGFGITELLPWDAYNLKEFLKELPLVNPAFTSHL